MHNRSYAKIALGLLIGFLFLVEAQSSLAGEDKEVPVKGLVTLVDLGANACLPCKMMAPIMIKLEKEYKGKAAIVFIDVWKNRDQADRFGIRAIPTQIFYDKKGKEVSRHEGFMSEKDIV
ncbi:MAG: thiol reductase thioredoxin, partial [Desulfobacca sp.]|nr:thiol reductase thioredoxin [Desulfobacca sp.]